jgi:hypothetical protein
MQRARHYHVFWVMLTVAVGLGIIVSIAACAPSGAAQSTAAGTSPQPSATASTTQGTVKGIVVAVPSCPVERAEQPCPPKAVSHRTVLIEAPGGAIVARVVTDQNGQFTVTLPPGTYTLTVSSVANAFPIQRKPQQVTVTAGQTVQVQIVLDSGIR